MLNENKNRMQDLPMSERPYEKCLELGPALLSNAELIAVLLKSGTKGRSALDLSRTLLSTYEGHHTLSRIFDSSTQELMEICGIGEIKAIMLQCVGELSKRIAKERALGVVNLSSPRSIANFYMESMRHLEQEEIRLAFFDTRNNLIKDVFLSRGTVNSSLITPREVFVKAVKYKAVSFVMVHNHPSGDPEPSKDDLILTNRLKDCAAIIGIPILDHIIIGDNRFVSFKEKGLL